MLIADFALSQRNPIVAGHVVDGRAVLPGLAYVDLVLQMFAREGHDVRELELSNLSIHAPLVVGPDDVVPVRLSADDGGRDRWWVDITVRPSTYPTTVVTVQVRRTRRTRYDGRLDTARLPAAGAGTALDSVYQRAREVGVDHSGVMRAQGRVYESEAELLLDLAPGAEELAAADDFLVHPALADAAVVAAGAVLGESRGELYLPLCFESFTVARPLRGRCLARVTGEPTGDRDLLTVNVDFFDPDGEQVASLRRFSSKRVEPRRNVAGAPEPQGDPADVVREVLAAELGVDAASVPGTAGFSELGLDSAALLRVVTALERRLDVTLPPTLLFEHSSVDRLAAWLRTRLPVAGTTTVGAPARTNPADLARPDAGHTREREVAGTDVAVIGMSGRYPGAANVDEFWRNLRDGRDGVTEIPAHRWDWRDRFDERPGLLGRNYCKWGGFIDDAECFDPLFFSIAPREAIAIDPLERLFLEHAWAALEDGGYTREALADSVVGVYAGVMFADYPLFAAESRDADGRRVGLGAGGASIANRVSYFCDFRGPSLTVDTACSSSLSTVHLAVEALREGRIDAALAGGVNLSLHPNKYLVLSHSEFLSPSGRCAAFGAGADGMVPGEGVGVLMLKRLADAERDGDPIHGVIKGTAINHGGKTSGFTVPSPQAQEDVVTAALSAARVDPATITYVEAHGTGTELGDPIEITGLHRSLGTAGTPVAVGSVKSNIGHCEAAAGVAGLTKVLLQLKHGRLAPTLHADRLNPKIDFGGTSLTVNTSLREWSRPVVDGVEAPRRAGVSSFGAGGANAHVVVEEYRDTRPRSTTSSEQVVVLSARTADRLDALAAALREYLAGAPAGGDAAEVLRRLVATASEVLAVPAERIDPECTLEDLGFDAARTARLTLAVERSLGTRLSPTIVDRGRSLAVLADRLAHECGLGASSSTTRPDENLPPLAEIAYTLQTGREDHAERLALVVGDHAQLVQRLDAFLAGERDEGLHRGSATAMDQRDDDRARTAVRERELADVARLWVRGASVPWDELHPRRPLRVSLPTYPFARERYWIGDVLTRHASLSDAAAPVAVSPVPSVLADVEEAVVTRPRVYEVESGVDDLVAYQSVVAALSRICRLGLLRVFRDMGALRTTGQRCSRAELRSRLGVVEQHHRLFDALLQLLAEAGYLRVDGEDVVTASAAEHDLDEEAAGLEAEKAALLERAPENEGLLRVLDVCSEAYPDVLRGRRDPVDVLFPGGSFELMDAVYQNQQQSNALMRAVVVEYVRRRRQIDPNATVTIVEIGAGTGGTSRGVLAALDEFAPHVRYVYTDLGNSFVRYGKEQFGHHGFVEFAVLDIERSPAEQGFPAHSADLVLAGNVLHATRDIDRTLAHTKELLRGGGVLALFEITRIHELLTMSFGLLEGWWAFEDTDRIPGAPLLSVPMWRRAFERNGFAGMRVLSGLPLREDRLSESVLVAESDGLPVGGSKAATPQPSTPPAPQPVVEPVPVAEPQEPDLVPEAVSVDAAPTPTEESTGEPTGEPTGIDDIQRLVLDAWREVLGVPQVRLEDNFQELGGDSIMASRIKARLNENLPFELELRDLLEAGTAADMAQLVEAEVIDKLEELPEETVRALFAN